MLNLVRKELRKIASVKLAEVTESAKTESQAIIAYTKISKLLYNLREVDSFSDLLSGVLNDEFKDIDIYGVDIEDLLSDTIDQILVERKQCNNH